MSTNIKICKKWKISFVLSSTLSDETIVDSGTTRHSVKTHRIAMLSELC